MSTSLGESLPILGVDPDATTESAGPTRRQTRQITVGPVGVGSESPITVQTMTVTPTHEVDTTLQAIAMVQAAGADLVRIAVPRREDADALADIAAHSQIPVIADIHFQWKYAVAAIEAGCAGVRINPGNIKKHDKVKLIGDMAGERGIAIRIGVNGGSLEDEILAEFGGPTPEAMVESALREVRLLEDVDFYNTKISVKHSDPWVMIQTYRLLAERCDYPFHLGVTEAGPKYSGSVKSAIGIGTLLAEGIGDTIRVSLSADPVEEIKAGMMMLESLHLRERGLDVVSCPSCGRAQVDVWKLAEDVQKGLDGKIDVPLRVAVMGCVVNGPGEAREADLGVAAGNGKGQIIKKGETIATVTEEDIVETIVWFAEEMADEIRAERGEGKPVVA
ncbi:flavodoxin-dependent (E)-4-hydroxy-3-methylbut-2-enyl-diphosphate synthase [Salsipaludibacter albus]|uniref:flavodoxin-dependent (E)-4-hydroxy-3-methylbut-2-enyl-diphosphate synthase n=1 Tax=Salsipaludibacter albus TaxID=2849650 RepID=UPI001EE3D501|nr:flavodoxin-dependent (E)-4-hydroxy-3-methylbut-2-enyl-diphosphate synthase [Salsipaludibacter albus]MBY5162843.1 flavodoxin-dependent (E)-4-hydroxy-3-methylbut-2-enyl-diphosphate synthase [Salsipaludibacter albus]